MRPSRPILLTLLVGFATLAGCIIGEQQGVDQYLLDQYAGQDDAGKILILQAAVAAGYDLDSWPTRDEPIASNLPRDSTYGDSLRLLHAVATAEIPERQWSALQVIVLRGFDGEQFGSNASIVDDALAVSGLIASGLPPDDARILAAVSLLQSTQAADGGWNFAGGKSGQVDETAWVARALNDAGAMNSTTANQIHSFLQDGLDKHGFYSHSGVRNCQSTGLSLIAWAAIDKQAPPEIYDGIQFCQNKDGGYPFIVGLPSQVWATSEIVQGLAA